MIPRQQHAITRAKQQLEQARESGDKLRIDLAEAAMNDLLEHFEPSDKTDNTKGKP